MESGCLSNDHSCHRGAIHSPRMRRGAQYLICFSFLFSTMWTKRESARTHREDESKAGPGCGGMETEKEKLETLQNSFKGNTGRAPPSRGHRFFDVPSLCVLHKVGATLACPGSLVRLGGGILKSSEHTSSSTYDSGMSSGCKLPEGRHRDVLVACVPSILHGPLRKRTEGRLSCFWFQAHQALCLHWTWVSFLFVNDLLPVSLESSPPTLLI